MKQETKSTAVKIAAVLVAAVIVINLILFSLGKASIRTFWFIVIAGAIVAYFILPHYRKR